MSDPYRRDTDVDPDLLAAYTRGVERAIEANAADEDRERRSEARRLREATKETP